MIADELEYVGFWARVAASLVDTILVLVVITPLLNFVYDAPASDAASMQAMLSGNATDLLANATFFRGPLDIFINLVLPALAVCAFWIARQATPGKMLISAKVVDARTGGKPGVGQCIVRYLGYYVSIIPLCLGLFWVGVDSRKQGWHDKLARTVVVRPKPKSVSFRADQSG